MLAELHQNVVTATSGRDALRALLTDEFAVVLLDVNMPGLSGYEVCRSIRDELGLGLPVLFVSGERTESFDRVAGLTIGAGWLFAATIRAVSWARTLSLA